MSLRPSVGRHQFDSENLGSMQRILGDFLTKHFIRFVGGVKPHHLLDPNEAAALMAAWRQSLTDRLRGPMYALAAIVLLSAASLAYWRSTWFPPQQPIVLDHQHTITWLGLIGAALLSIGAFYCLLERLLLFWSFPGGYELGCKVYATKHGWLPTRSLIFGGVLFLFMISMFIVAGWQGGERVDSQGILRTRVFAKPTLEPLSDVRTCTLYANSKWLFGRTRSNPTVVVTFRSAPPWKYSTNSQYATPASTVAAHVCYYSGVPLLTGATAP